MTDDLLFSYRELEAKKTLEDDRLQLQNSIELSLSQLQQKEGELSSWRVKVIFLFDICAVYGY